MTRTHIPLNVDKHGFRRVTFVVSWSPDLSFTDLPSFWSVLIFFPFIHGVDKGIHVLRRMTFKSEPEPELYEWLSEGLTLTWMVRYGTNRDDEV